MGLFGRCGLRSGSRGPLQDGDPNVEPDREDGERPTPTGKKQAQLDRADGGPEPSPNAGPDPKAGPKPKPDAGLKRAPPARNKAAREFDLESNDLGLVSIVITTKGEGQIRVRVAFEDQTDVAETIKVGKKPPPANKKRSDAGPGAWREDETLTVRLAVDSDALRAALTFLFTDDEVLVQSETGKFGGKLAD